ncbi:MAG: small ligand-binding sensory domain FIST [Arenicella sp.]|jgi:small ligand-binding sensory domain FIST
MIKRRVATGASYGAIAKDEYAREAVKHALAKMRPCTVGSVLLFLSNEYAHSPQNAIKEAAKAAGTPLVFGCCAVGLLTEEEWLLDVEGAVAMVFPQDLSMQPLRVLRPQGINPKLVLTLASPNAVDIAISSCDSPQFGSVTSDEYGQGPYSVWQSGRIVEQEYCQTAFSKQLEHQIVLAEGVEHLSPVMQINRSEGNIVYQVNLQGAYDNISSHVSVASPFDLFCAVSETSNPESIEHGHYQLIHVLDIDQQANTVTLADDVKAGRHVFWARRNISSAQASIESELENAKQRLGKEPEFGLMFANVTRGPEFFGGIDMDLEAFKNAFPGTPLIGFYGNAEIAPGFKAPARQRHHATVSVLFA